MAKVKKRKARKDYPAQGIKRGDEYYTWQLYRGPVMRSMTPPSRSQLTGSEFLGQVYDLVDVTFANAESPDDFKEGKDELDNIKDELQSRFENMPQQLQDADTGQLLQTRIDSCEEWSNTIDSAADTYESAVSEIDEDESLSDEEKEEKRNEAKEACLEEVNGAEPSWE